jgi:hypothetical protein
MSHKSSAPAGKDFEIVPAGTHLAMCCTVAFLGWHQPPPYNGKKSDKQPQMLFTWELCEEMMKDGKPFTISGIYKDSLHVKAGMRKVLECWRGKRFTEEELQGFDVIKLLGKPCFLAIIHKEVGEDKELKAKISAVSKVTKGTKPPAMVNPPLYYTVEHGDPDSCDVLMLPEWIQKKCAARLDAPTDKARQEPPLSEESDDEIPF